jgi:putative flavoprotein involved in K+ transport
VPGLYFLGLTWQHTRGSALIGFIKDDADLVAEKIAENQQAKASAQAGTPLGAGATGEGRSTERTSHA